MSSPAQLFRPAATRPNRTIGTTTPAITASTCGAWCPPVAEPSRHQAGADGRFRQVAGTPAAAWLGDDRRRGGRGAADRPWAAVAGAGRRRPRSPTVGLGRPWRVGLAPTSGLVNSASACCRTEVADEFWFTQARVRCVDTGDVDDELDGHGVSPNGWWLLATIGAFGISVILLLIVPNLPSNDVSCDSTRLESWVIDASYLMILAAGLSAFLGALVASGDRGKFLALWPLFPVLMYATFAVDLSTAPSHCDFFG
jgi:hypothetical protein